MAYMKASDYATWICGDGDQSIGYVNGKPCIWYGQAELMPFSEYEEAREGEIFECLDGTEQMNKGGWMEISKYVGLDESLDQERMVAIWT